MESTISSILGGILFLAWIVIGAMTGHDEYESWRKRYLETAQRYHVAHALTFLAVAHHPALNWFSLMCWLAGIFLFSGNLYRKFFQSSQEKIKLIPLGGILFMLGWAYFILRHII